MSQPEPNRSLRLCVGVDVCQVSCISSNFRRGDAEVLPPSEQRIDLVRWTTGPLHSQHHVKVMVRELLESVVDSVFDKIHGVTVPAENTAENAKRRSKLYAELGREVSTFCHNIYSKGFAFLQFSHLASMIEIGNEGSKRALAFVIEFSLCCC